MLLNYCSRHLEDHTYVLPQHKYMYLRVLPYILSLTASDTVQIFKGIKDKQFKLERYGKLIKRSPVIPVFGDVSIIQVMTMQTCAGFNLQEHASIFGGQRAIDDPKYASEYLLTNHLDDVRSEQIDFISFWTLQMDVVRGHMKERKPYNRDMATKIIDAINRGFRLLATWTAQVHEQTAWKYAKPPDADSGISIQEGSMEYERLVRQNYSRPERFALVEYLATIKSVASAMAECSSLLAGWIRLYVHDITQDFIQNGMEPMIRRAMKKKRKTALAALNQVQSIAADWLNNTPVEVNPKKKPKKGERISYNLRPAGITPTQLHLIRGILYSTSHEDAPGMQGGVFSDKDFKGKHVTVIKEWMNASFAFPYLLNYTGTLSAVSDLGSLWYREFFLDLGKCIQFPIDSSLPWIITNEILNERNSSLMESIFYPLDLYNDAANIALHDMKQQFLFDEIEAELNLAFDQLVFKLSDQIYTHFKTVASCLILDKPYKKQLDNVLKGGNRFIPPKSRYEAILKQRHLQLLGRSIDLNLLITQRLRNLLRENIDMALQRFESGNICHITDLEHLLSQIKLTHKLISEHVEIDSYDAIFNEVNDSTSLVSFHGRIVIHALGELVNDLFPNYIYNGTTQRFVQAPYTFTDPVERASSKFATSSNYLYGTKHLNIAYQYMTELTKGFCGLPHITALFRLLGPDNFPVVVEECIGYIETVLTTQLQPYFSVLLQGLPQSTKLPGFEYGTEGCFGYFELRLGDVLTYSDVKSEVCQSLRAVGNALIFLNLAEVVMSQHEGQTFIQAAPFLGCQPTADGKGEQTNKFYSDPTQNLVTAMRKFGTDLGQLAKAPSSLRDLVITAERADKVYRPTDKNLSVFKHALERVNKCIDSVRTEWQGGDLCKPNQDSPFMVDNSREFYRLWSTLQFLFCLPNPADEYTNMELFGEGFGWAGCIIIYLLGQEHRFNTFDFAYHVVNVEDSTARETFDPTMKKFIENARKIRDQNSSVFNILRAFLKPSRGAIYTFHPPANLKGTSVVHETNLTGASPSLERPAQPVRRISRSQPNAPQVQTSSPAPAAAPAAPAPAPAAPAPAPPAPAPAPPAPAPPAPAAAPPAPAGSAPLPPPGGPPPAPPPGPPPGGPPAPPPGPPPGGPPAPPPGPPPGGPPAPPPGPPPGGPPAPPPGPPPGGAPPPPPPPGGAAPPPPPPPGGAPPPPPPPGGAPPPPPPPM
eukprot:TRINITY_DN1407_c0_g1_i1.p1 TRINITY_DN1407_c0_g1~~TRINITY_DN1407_c0_g1_i1.p1  ORF type:complete len:1349 (+),score=375.75 TRINITY_DN1407_c0_g1_i1:400-4047(+)